MSLKSYLSKMPPIERGEFAKRCGTTKGHLQNVMYGTVPLAPIVCVAIERESAGAVTRKDLRPDDWRKIWPELTKTPANHSQVAIKTVADGVSVDHPVNHGLPLAGGLAVCQPTAQGVA